MADQLRLQCRSTHGEAWRVKAHGLAVAALLAWALCAAQPALGQDPVDGVCHDVVRNGCSAGTPNDAALADTSNAYKWRCDGLHGGRNSRICFIRVEDVVDGVCDESRRNGCSAGTPNAAAYPDEPVVYQWRCDGLGGGRNSGRCALWFSVVGVCDESVRNGCSAGNPNDDAFPDSSTEYAWRCDGLNAGANSGRCSRHVPVDGACDDSARNGCSAGTANDDAVADTSNAYLWRCDGLYGGENSDKCHMFKPVNGVCNDSVRNGCAAGVPNDDAFPDAGSGGFVWRCDGEHGGRNSDKCFIRSVDGVCDDSVRNGCSAGTPNDDAIADTANAYLWRCDGLHGGADSEKCHKFIPVDGVCDENVRNGCSAGAANDGAVPDISNAHLWRCDGLHGGANSEKCFKFIPVDGVCDESARNGCAAGTANDGAVPDISNAYLWRCDGLHGGENSEKCLKFMGVDGVCDESVRNGCSAGTANDDAIADTANAYLWRCDGLHGGANSDRCRKSIPVDGACDESVRNGCSAGTANDDAIADTSSAYLWRCDGLHGGTNSERCRKFMAVDGGWSDWSACSATACGGSGTQTRSCDSPSPEHGGQECLKLDGTRGTSETRSCTGASALDGGWSAWSSCSASCGTGRQTRTCTNPAPGCGGSACSGPSLRSCTANARVDGGWSAWSACSASACGLPGTQTRACTNPSPACGGAACVGPASQSCTGSDPRDCWWGGSWSTCACTASTGDASNAGTQSKVQVLPAACGGTPCTGPSSPILHRRGEQLSTDCGTCNCTTSTTDSDTAGICSISGASCATSACPQACGPCSCTPDRNDSKTAGICGISGASCVTSGCPQACGTCNCTPDRNDSKSAGICSISGEACTVRANNCPQTCGNCNCTSDFTDSASAGICSIGGEACTVAANNCPVCGACRCTASTTDGASAGVCSISGAACTVSAGNCPPPISCGAPWPSTPTGTSLGIGSVSVADRKQATVGGQQMCTGEIAQRAAMMVTAVK